MKILSVKNNKFDSTFEVEIEAKEWKVELAKTKKNLAANINVPGFRKGHVPQAEFDKRVPASEISYRTLQKMQEKMIKDIIASKEFTDSDCIDSVTKIEVVKVEPSPIIKLNFELVPKVENFEPTDVKKIVIPPFNFKDVKPEVVKHQVKMMIRPDAMISAKKDAVVAKGDIAVIDFKGFVDGKPFKGGEAKAFELEIGSKSFIDNFEDQLIGCKKGDKKTVNVSFPKDYHVKDLASKPAKFEVEIKDVKSIEYPEITKDYCKKFGMDCNSMAELETHIKDLFKQEAEMRYQETSMKIINEAISKKAKLNYYPISLIEMHKNQILKQYEMEARRYGAKTLEQYKKRLGVDNDKFNELLTTSAKSTLTVASVYEDLIEKYKLAVEPADEKDYLSKMARYFGNEKTAKEMYEKNKDWASSTILREKLFKKLIAEAKKEEPKSVKAEAKKEEKESK